MAAYWPAMHSPFVFDDATFILGQPNVTGTSPLSLFHANRVLTLLTYRINYRLFGPDPLAFHLTTIALHIGVGLLVLWFALSVCHLSMNAALFACGLFVLHPMQSQAVIYMAQRSEVLAAAGIVASCLAFARRRWLLAVLFFVLAVMAKEHALILPMLWLLIAWRENIAVSSELAIMGSSTALLALASPTVRGAVRGAIDNGGDYLGHSYALLALASRFVWPAHLTIDHDFSAVSLSAGALSAGVLIALIMVGLYQRRHPLGFCLLWCFALTVPHIFAEPAGYLAEHHFYAASIGLCIGAGFLFESFTTTPVKEQLIYGTETRS